MPSNTCIASANNFFVTSIFPLSLARAYGITLVVTKRRRLVPSAFRREISDWDVSKRSHSVISTDIYHSSRVEQRIAIRRIGEDRSVWEDFMLLE